MENAVTVAIVWMPLALGIKGYIVGAFAGLLFNLFAAVSGGIEIDVKLGGEPAASEAASVRPAIAS